MSTAWSALSVTEVPQQRAPGSGPYPVASIRPTEQREQASVQRYLDRFAEAMTSGDTRTMTSLWGVPAFVLGAKQARIVPSEGEVARRFEAAKKIYDERGITHVQAEIQHLDWVGTDLVIVNVRWLYLNAKEEELGEACASHTLLRGEGGGYRLRSLLLRDEAALLMPETDAE